MASDGPSPLPPSLRLGLAAHQPSRRHQAQSWPVPAGPLTMFHNPRTPHVLVYPPEQAVHISRRGDERRHAVGSHSALALRLYLAAFNPLSSCRF